MSRNRNNNETENILCTYKCGKLHDEYLLIVCIHDKTGSQFTKKYILYMIVYLSQFIINIYCFSVIN